MPEHGTLRYHEDGELFRAAVRITADQTAFPYDLIEKDYFCSVALELLSAQSPPLIFKGGTSLSKVHVGFYRMSEDLDFSISIAEKVSPKVRSRAVDGARRMFDTIGAIRGMHASGTLQGSNGCRQYSGRLAYDSLLEDSRREIKLEVGVREPIQQPPVVGEVKTLLRDPISGKAAVPIFTVHCLDWQETIAEKLRAALTRTEPAIRDFFDIQFASRRTDLPVQTSSVYELLRRKLAISGTGPVDLSTGRLALLRRQIRTDLRPVLCPEDLGAFDLDRAFETVREIARAVDEL